jgi:hypothetical protein
MSCAKCVHFVPPPVYLVRKPDIKKGKCSLFAKIHTDDIEFENAKKAYDEICKGKFFREEAP